jgi:hypothetical protein
VTHTRTPGPGDTPGGQADLGWFRREFYASLTARADALFELTDAVLCADGPVTSPVELTLLAEHRRGHGAMYDALNAGGIAPQRLHRALGEELGDGQGDDVGRCGDVGDDAAHLRAGQAVRDGAEAEDDLVAVDGVDVEVDGHAGAAGAGPASPTVAGSTCGRRRG